MENVDKENILSLISSLTQDFSYYNLEDYHTFFALYFNNMTVLKEEDDEINKALSKLICHINDVTVIAQNQPRLNFYDLFPNSIKRLLDERENFNI